MHPYAYLVGGFIGALILTFVLSRLLFWITKKWDGGTRKIFFVHAVSFTACVLYATWDTFYMGGLREAFPFGCVFYAVAQLIWMGVDLFRQRKREQSNMPTAQPI
jgi:hypothetical protein